MGILHSLSDYVRAIASAKKIHNLSTPAAVRSVARAKFIFGVGPRIHALFGLGGVNESDWANFQHHKELEEVLRVLNPLAMRRVSHDKVQFSRHCETHGIAQILTIYHDQPADHILRDIERREEFCRKVDPVTDPIFCKLVDGEHGHGAFVAQRVHEHWFYCGEKGTTEDLYDFCRKRQGNSFGWLVQPVLKTHSSLLAISSSNALSTARVITCATGDGPVIMLALMKLARSPNQTDNFHLGMSGNMVAKIDIDSGRLGPAMGSLRGDFPAFTPFPVDPVNGEPIDGRVVPFWRETKAIALKAQGTLPQLKSLGWDIAITDLGPVVVESNANYASEIMEVAYGRGLRPLFIDRLKQLG